MNHHVGRAGKAWQLGIVAAVVLTATSARAVDSESLRLLLLGAQDMNTPQTVLRADIAIALETYKGPRTTAGDRLLRARQGRALVHPAEGARHCRPRARRRAQGHAAQRRHHPDVLDQRADRRPRRQLRGPEPLHRRRLQALADRRREQRHRARGRPSAGRVGVRLSRVHVRQGAHDPAQGPVLREDAQQPREAAHRLRSPLVGKKWFPGTIEIQNFPENSKAKLSINWSQAATAPPELLAPESFPGTSPVPWTSPAPAPAHDERRSRSPATPAPQIRRLSSSRGTGTPCGVPSRGRSSRRRGASRPGAPCRCRPRCRPT